LELPPGAKPVTDPNAPVATIRPLATAETVTEEEAETEEGAAEPEVITRGKEEEEKEGSSES
ncbi:hypothetical protein L9G16_22960, partial [Shewanella sp. A25]|nr:hypothetical protein [Shewanella shenzhenensis]